MQKSLIYLFFSNSSGTICTNNFYRSVSGYLREYVQVLSCRFLKVLLVISLNITSEILKLIVVDIISGPTNILKCLMTLLNLLVIATTAINSLGLVREHFTVAD